MSVKSSIRNFFFKILFIHLTETEGSQVGREAGRERRKQAPHWAESLMWTSISGHWDHDLSPRQRLNPLSHPGTPRYLFLIYLLNREHTSRGSSRQREMQTPTWAGSPMWDSIPRPGIVTWAEGRGLTNWATQVPHIINILIYLLYRISICPPISPSYFLIHIKVSSRHKDISLLNTTSCISLVRIHYLLHFWSFRVKFIYNGIYKS